MIGCGFVFIMAERVELQSRCAFYLAAKRRNCKMLVVRGSKYCGQHIAMEEDNSRKRVPCPLDPKHNVYEDQLAKHLHKCNAKAKPSPVYYCEGINGGSLVPYVPCKEETQSLTEFPAAVVEDMIHRVSTAYTKQVGVIEKKCLEHHSMLSALREPSNGATALKHLKQQASILGHLEEKGLLSADTCYVEFGAGRGKLSHCIQQAMPDHHSNQYVLVDRANCRRKMDSYHKTDDAGPLFTRLLMDIEHLNLGAMRCVRDCRNIVGVSKHLCGAATDLAIRCYCTTLPSKMSEPLTSKTDGSKVEFCGGYCDYNDASCLDKRPDHADNSGVVVTDKISKLKASSPHNIKNGLVMASCCHHRCNWTSYVGQAFFEQLGFGPAEFHLITLMSSWAVCGTRISSTDDHSNCRGYVPHVRESVGIHCKRLIDAGRVWYLEQRGFSAVQCHYVEKNISLENTVIIATLTNK